MYYIPAPDYRRPATEIFSSPVTFEAPENLIPPPDYARYEPQVDYEPPVERSRPKAAATPRLPHREEKPIEREIPKIETPILNSQKQEESPRYITKVNNYVEKLKDEAPSPFAVHSYLEDKDKLETPSFLNESTRTHIRSIGVPVLPPIGRSHFAQEASPGALSPAQNKAFIRHLENHRKFDTMKSLRSCRECPLCQMMLGAAGLQEGEVESAARQRRTDVRDIFSGEADLDWTLTRRSYNERAEGEISVGFREKIQVLQTEETHALCRKTDGSMGWLPLYIVQ